MYLFMYASIQIPKTLHQGLNGKKALNVSMCFFWIPL